MIALVRYRIASKRLLARMYTNNLPHCEEGLPPGACVANHASARTSPPKDPRLRFACCCVGRSVRNDHANDAPTQKMCAWILRTTTETKWQHEQVDRGVSP